MRNLISILSWALLVVISSCSGPVTSSSTATPEEFAKTLVSVLKSKDSVSYQKLIATQDNVLKFFEASEEYKNMQPNMQLFAKAAVESTYARDNKQINKGISRVFQNFKFAGITAFDNAKLIKVEYKDPWEKNAFWINTTVEIDGEQHILRCERVILIPGEGFRLNEDAPKLWHSRDLLK